MTDSRLIGTWRSDAPRTLQEIAARRDIPTLQRRKLARFFGKLELRYTQSKCYSRTGADVLASGYLVLAKDASSVAILSSNSIAGEQIHHIHFEGSHFWIFVGSGKVREFFRRVKTKRHTK